MYKYNSFFKVLLMSGVEVSESGVESRGRRLSTWKEAQMTSPLHVLRKTKVEKEDRKEDRLEDKGGRQGGKNKGKDGTARMTGDRALVGERKQRR